MLINGDSLNELKKIETNSVDLIVTDPPYGYSFMGKAWDKALPDKRIWKECLRVLKHGGFAYVMSAPRQDVLARMMIDLEDTGFKTDFTSMYWAYATGFPKAMNISKAVDKKLGVKPDSAGIVKGMGKQNSEWNGKGVGGRKEDYFKPEYEKVLATSEEAKKLDGSYAGFQPKPAVEVIIVCMKPLEEKGYVDQALKNGKGVSWFDDCRIPTGDSDKYDLEQREVSKAHGIQNDDSFLDQIHDADAKHGVQEKGRFPANVIVSDDSLNNGVETESIRSKRGGSIGTNGSTDKYEGGWKEMETFDCGYNDKGSFSRYYDLDRWWKSQFIITPKASKSEKNKGLEKIPEKKYEGRFNNAGEWKNMERLVGKNNHPTVKPLKLMSYLITLGSREGDVVLDPFMGSGTTPLASKNLGRKYIGIEREEEYFKICCARVGDEATVLEKEAEDTKIEEPIVEEKPKKEPTIEEKPREEPVVEELSNICEVCGANYNGMTYEEHEQRPFHQDRLQ